MVLCSIITRLFWRNVLYGVSIRSISAFRIRSADDLDKLDLVKRVLVDLHRSLKQSEEAGQKWLSFHRLDPFDFVKSQQSVANSPKTVSL
jgi:hypothetical protein